MSQSDALEPKKFAGIPLKPYRHGFGLNRLKLGVDNLRYDLHLSPGFIKATRRMALQLIGRISGVSDLPDYENGFNWYRGEKEFKGLCRDIMSDAVKQAKLDNEYQILFLVKTAIAVTMKEAVNDRYKACLQHINNLIWRQEMAYNHDQVKHLQEALQILTRNRDTTVRSANAGLFRYITEVLQEGLNDLYTLHFGPESLLPEDFFANPLLHTENPTHDSFLMAEYVLLGSRREDVNQYDAFLEALNDFLARRDGRPEEDLPAVPAAGPGTAGSETASQNNPQASQRRDYTDWLKQEANMDALFNYYRSEQMLRRDKRRSGDKQRIRKLKQVTRQQKRLLTALVKEFNARELTYIVVASEEMKAFCDNYCPPLTPHELLQYIVDRKSRKPIRAKLKRIKKNYGEDYSLQPIRECLSRIRWLPRPQKMEILLDFVKTFARYHRDLCNYNLVSNAISYINFVNDDAFLKLSRANHSLYEFLLPNEQKPDEMPIISHTVLKADVRGSTGIVHEMKSQGMNPATNFSLNFFDPITNILSRFGAYKVFIEGDAIILSLFEHENQPQNWYSVARACGLAMNILLIVQRYNRKNVASRLPLLEIGIGISYAGSPPTFFFDEDNRIMISPAINQADRLSGCFKPLREQAAFKQSPFNVFVYEIAETDRKVAAGQYIRYNVNGIELSDDGFAKLQKEIQLEQLDLKAPGAEGEPHQLFVGKYPTVSGTSHQLVIRQAPLPIMALSNHKITGSTGRFYYEVCTHPALLRCIRELRPD
jgi:hypothetical protein